jgi:hypothetical protein
MLNFDRVFLSQTALGIDAKSPQQSEDLQHIARPSLRGHEANQVTHRKLVVADGFDWGNFSNKVRRNQQY